MIWTDKEIMRWHRKFAWFPVELGRHEYPKRYAWLQFVWARSLCSDRWGLWEYEVGARPEDYPEELIR